MRNFANYTFSEESANCKFFANCKFWWYYVKLKAAVMLPYPLLMAGYQDSRKGCKMQN